jgi:hypothetical protein
MRIFILIVFLLSIISCEQTKTIANTDSSKNEINLLLNQWHIDVATYNYDAYFDKMTEKSVFVGTDAAEVWSKQEFQSFCKPFFEKQSTWNFKPVKRNIYLAKDKQTAWFDETLDTWMGVCRGSGILVKQNKDWKIAHYVLSVAVPNDDIKAVVAIIKERDSLYLHTN